jgi:hypothetical protein
VSDVVISRFRDDVDVVGAPAAGHPDVEVFAVQTGSGEEDADVGGGALGAVDGGGPAIVGVFSDIGRR